MLGFSCSSFAVAFMLVLFMICAISEAVRYRVKFTVFILLSMIASSWPIPIMLFRIRDWRNALIPAWGARQISKLLGVKFTVKGLENIHNETGSIVLINHQSSIDLFVLAYLWPVLERSTVISKKAILYSGPFGLASWLWGTIFIDRENNKEAQKTFNKTAHIIKERKAKLLLFPEGKRHSGNQLLPLKKGGFHVAIDAQIPIQPVVVSRYYFLNSKAKKFDSGMSDITILPAIETKGMTKEDIPELMNRTYEAMNAKFIESSQEVLANHMYSLSTSL